MEMKSVRLLLRPFRLNAFLILLLLLLAPGAALAAGTIEPITVNNWTGNPVYWGGTDPAVSGDGRYVVYRGYSWEVSENWGYDTIVAYDRETLTARTVSVANSGELAYGVSWNPAISKDGRYVAFISQGTNLVATPAVTAQSIYVHDLQTRLTELVSLSSAGVPGDASSWGPSLSADGHFVVFSSDAANLVFDDTNGVEDVFVFDRTSRSIERVSVDSIGNQGTGGGNGGQPRISDDGRYVAFAHAGDNLVPGDSNGALDLFVRDRAGGTTQQVNLSSGGSPVSVLTGFAMSGDGRYVAFATQDAASPDDTNGQVDIYLRDLVSQTTVRSSLGPDGVQSDGESREPALSGDGRYLTFLSTASNLVAGGANGAQNVFLRDLVTGATELISLTSAGEQTIEGGDTPAINTDGRYVAFASASSGMVPNGAPGIYLRDRQGLPDTTPPEVTASLPGGTYPSGVWVTLTANEPARILYTNWEEDDFWAYPSRYTEPVSHWRTPWTLRFAAIDRMGNRSEVYQNVYSIAEAAPVSQGTVERVSVATDGTQGDFGTGAYPWISGDGQVVSYYSHATTMVPGDTNGTVDDPWMGTDVFVRNRLQGTTERASVSSTGEQGNGPSDQSSVSRNGRYVVFTSLATNLVPGDGPGEYYWCCGDTFLRDLQEGTTERISVSSTGEPADRESWGRPTANADGRFVAFTSVATNLVPDLPVGNPDEWISHVYVRDRALGTTERVDLSSSGEPANSWSSHPVISGEGRYVVFRSWASNLVDGDTNELTDIFVRDRQTGTTTRVNVTTSGQQTDRGSGEPYITPDGRYVSFTSWAENLVPDDTNDEDDIFVHDRLTGVTERVSLSAGGVQVNDYPEDSSMSADGRYVVFRSWANTLVDGDTNNRPDIFVHDRVTRAMVRVSISNTGEQGNDSCYDPHVNDTGAAIVFECRSTNLVPGDTNDAYDVFVIDWTGVAQPVSIDIRPGGEGSIVSLNGRGMIPVVLSSSASFDATTVDLSTVTFGGASPASTRTADLNQDGLTDMMLMFRAGDLTLPLEVQKYTMIFTLTGRTTSGQVFSGSDSVRIVSAGRPVSNEKLQVAKDLHEKEGKARDAERSRPKGRPGQPDPRAR